MAGRSMEKLKVVADFIEIDPASAYVPEDPCGLYIYASLCTSPGAGSFPSGCAVAHLELVSVYQQDTEPGQEH
jgi:hypothetical protein